MIFFKWWILRVFILQSGGLLHVIFQSCGLLLMIFIKWWTCEFLNRWTYMRDFLINGGLLRMFILQSGVLLLVIFQNFGLLPVSFF